MIIEFDVNLVMIDNVIIVGFNVCFDMKVCECVVCEGVDICFYFVIYNVIDEIESLFKGMFKLEYEEV